MLQREIVRFRVSDTQPNPLEVDYWIDVTSNYYGGCIRYYRNDTNTWEMLDLSDKNELKTYIDGKVTDLTELINQEITNRINADNNLQSQINELKQLITNAQNAIDTHAARRDNPHIVTRAQLSLDTTDNVVFNKVSAPSGFFKE